MAVTLIGEVVNSCDATTGFSAGNISADDDEVEGTGALGAKVSNTTTSFYTTSLGAGAPYDFSTTGAERKYHIIMYFGNKTPTNATTGLRIVVGDGTDRGEWYVPLTGLTEPKQSIFVSRVIFPELDFDNLAAGTSWTLTGNSGQLTAITQMGGTHTTITSIMGSFNNCQIDQITIGLGCRVDGGTVGTPNNFETVRAQDEDTSKWGWFSSVLGNVVVKGGLFIGPATGSTTSVFTSIDESLTFADERVASSGVDISGTNENDATGFYGIRMRGNNTDVTWTRLSMKAADSAVARWHIQMNSDNAASNAVNSFAATGGSWIGGGVLDLDANATLTDVVMSDIEDIQQNGATITGCRFLEAATADGVALITSDDPELISNCAFDFSDGHAIEITAAGTYDFDGNIFTGYGADGTNDAAIYNNSGGAVTLNIGAGGTTPTVRNGAGATTTVNNPTSFTLTDLVVGSEVRIFRVSDRVELAGIESCLATFTYEYGWVSDTDVYVIVQKFDQTWLRINRTLTNTDQSVPVFQQEDPDAVNP